MDYTFHYDTLIQKAKSRTLMIEYYELHHIVPRCMGGTDELTNIVKLTGREHFTAHLLLTKIYPNNDKLLFAAAMMCASNIILAGRSKNKMYSWLKVKRNQALSRTSAGSNNSQYGSVWITDGVNSKKSKVGQCPTGWFLGRSITQCRNKVCPQCNVTHTHRTSKFCSELCGKISRNTKLSLAVHELSYKHRENEFLELVTTEGLSVNAALIKMGYSGNQGKFYVWAKQILNKRPIV